jgi:hypothetical protein
MPSAKKQSVSLQELVEKGFLQPLKRGRPPLYNTDEERREVHRAQQRECVKRHAERVREARRHMQATAPEIQVV